MGNFMVCGNSEQLNPSQVAQNKMPGLLQRGPFANMRSKHGNAATDGAGMSKYRFANISKNNHHGFHPSFYYIGIKIVDR